VNFFSKETNYRSMKTIILICITITFLIILFRPMSKKELKKFSDNDNWSNMGF